MDQPVPDRGLGEGLAPQLNSDELADLAESLALHREWAFYIKLNRSDWKVESFNKMYKIKTIKEMWQVLNNTTESLTGLANIFFMENDIVPLWECDKQLWSKGGCWSTIIKGTHWIDSMKEVCMIVFGESFFEESEVKGICIVPVATTHCIIKLWTPSDATNTGANLKSSLEKFNCCNPRFKAFA